MVTWKVDMSMPSGRTRLRRETLFFTQEMTAVGFSIFTGKKSSTERRNETGRGWNPTQFDTVRKRPHNR